VGKPSIMSKDHEFTPENLLKRAEKKRQLWQANPNCKKGCFGKGKIKTWHPQHGSGERRCACAKKIKMEIPPEEIQPESEET